jgi:hypothetical protein
VRYDLGGGCARFEADVGVDDEVGDNGAVVFQVWVDGTQIYASGVLTGAAAAQPVGLDVGGVHELRLVVIPGADTTDYAHADWAGARVTCGP